jgi:hypothetical protein
MISWKSKAYALVKALKEFRVYILHSHTVAYVPNNSVKEIWLRLSL